IKHMTNFNEQFERYADLQSEAFAPMRAFGGVAAHTFELVARQNYAVVGDCIDFAVDQARLAGEVQDLNDYIGQQISRSRVFGEKLAQRAQEYATIATTTQQEAAEVVKPKRAKAKTAASRK
ncbi:MAG: phasin family protein, partial [Woeseiaceae bacterium]